jgi:hypothetical protein
MKRIGQQARDGHGAYAARNGSDCPTDNQCWGGERDRVASANIGTSIEWRSTILRKRTVNPDDGAATSCERMSTCPANAEGFRKGFVLRQHRMWERRPLSTT